MRLMHMITALLCLAAATMEAKKTTTPIKHLVVIFQENRPFDHYFGTYPHAENNPGEPHFSAKSGTPSVNGLSDPLLSLNKNLSQPHRLGPSEVNTCNPDHTYTVLQEAIDSGLMDKFVQTNGANCTPHDIVMGYFDGNTVTALWNYAQSFALSDNFHTTNIGQSTIGVLNLVSGQTHGVLPPTIPHTVVQGTVIKDIDPKYDVCSLTPQTIELTGKNVGNLLNDKGITWGWFQGGFRDCTATHMGPNGPVVDYVPHHNPFQYYQSTSNPDHLPPTSVKMIGNTDQANHLYDLKDFWAAVDSGHMPAVSFLKARAFQNGHAGNSTPLLEQQFLVSTINKLQKTHQWKHLAIIIAYDDSGGFYDHEVPPIINQSQIPDDAFVGPGSAGSISPIGGYQGRPSYGYRVPMLIISQWAKENYVDSTLTDQTSILRFIEDNWKLEQIGDFSLDAFSGSLLNMFDFSERKKRKLILDPKTGEVK